MLAVHLTTPSFPVRFYRHTMCQNGRTPLHKAASERHPAVAEVLLAAGADKDIADKVGRWLAAPTAGGSRAERGGGCDGGNVVNRVV